jgi:hypothetical protein
MDQGTQSEREYMMARRQIEAMIIGDVREINGVKVTRPNSLHYSVQGNGMVVDLRARKHSMRFLERVTALTIDVGKA